MEPLIQHFIQNAALLCLGHPGIHLIPKASALLRFCKHKTDGIVVHIRLQNRHLGPLAPHHLQGDLIRGKGVDFPGLQRHRKVRQTVIVDDLRMRKPGQNIPVKRGTGLHAEAFSVQILKLRRKLAVSSDGRRFRIGRRSLVLCPADGRQRREKRRHSRQKQAQNKYAKGFSFHAFPLPSSFCALRSARRRLSGLPDPRPERHSHLVKQLY